MSSFPETYNESKFASKVLCASPTRDHSILDCDIFAGPSKIKCFHSKGFYIANSLRSIY